jgi:hypothetical protein
MSYLADDTQAIAARMKELKAEKDEAIKGTSAPVDGQESKTEDQPTGYGGLYYTIGTAGMASAVNTPVNTIGLYSLGHPEWPYAGTGFEWRKFVRS